MSSKFNIRDFAIKKMEGRKITMLTAYDYTMARIIDSSGIDSILVGDSLGMVVLGYESTISVTMDDMIHHAKAVRRGTKGAFLIGDMPFMSFQAGDEDGVRNAGRFMKEASCDAVKVEGGKEMLPRIEAIIRAGIPVMGHIGLTPQSIAKIGSYKVQGKEAGSAAKLEEDAIVMEKAGCFAIVLECVPKDLSKKITASIKIPTIGIGAGPYCDGQVLVTNDLIGYFDKFVPKFVKQYANIKEDITKAINSFKEEIASGRFPDDLHSF